MIFRESLGIDIRADRASLVFLRKGFRDMEVAGKALYRLDPGLDDRVRLTAIRGFLAEFRKENRIGPTEMFVGIPPELVMIRVVSLPFAVRENLAGTLRYEMEKLVPLPAQDVRFDYQVVSEDREAGQIRVALLIVKRPILEPFLELAETVPGGISGLEPASSALGNALSLNGAGGGKFDRGPDGVLDLFLETSEKNPFDEIGTVLGLPIQEYGAAAGLALRGMLDCPLQWNLVPPAFRRRPGRLGLYVAIILLSLSLIAGLAWGGALLQRQRAEAERIDAEIRRLSEEVIRVRELEENIESIRGRIETLRSFQAGHVPAIEILREMTQIVPENAWVQEFTLSGDKVRFSGKAESASELIGRLESSPLFRDVVFRSAIVREEGAGERFNIEMELETSSR